MVNKIISDFRLTCTEIDFNKFVSGYISSHKDIGIFLKKMKFSEKFNGVKIKNPFFNKKARYYILSIEGGNTYLQTHIPFIEGMEMITDDNFDSVSQSHCSILSKQFIEDKAISEAISFFTNK